MLETQEQTGVTVRRTFVLVTLLFVVLCGCRSDVSIDGLSFSCELNSQCGEGMGCQVEADQASGICVPLEQLTNGGVPGDAGSQDVAAGGVTEGDAGPEPAAPSDTVSDPSDAGVEPPPIDPGAGLAGALETGVSSISFSNYAVTMQHKQDSDPEEDGCITKVDITLSGPTGCTLTVEAGERLDWQGRLAVLSVTLVADSQCPGFLDEQEGTYIAGSALGSGIGLGSHTVPGDNLAVSVYEGGLTVQLNGELERTTDGAKLIMDGTEVHISGPVTSKGEADVYCPCQGLCDGKTCGADGCGGLCGVCDDGEPCTTDSCLEGTCSFKDDVTCDDEDACTTDQCVAGDGCQWTEKVCDDDNPCTVDSCTSELGCQFSDDDGASCEEDNVCWKGSCCVPQCDDKSCGDDGCGQLCGGSYWGSCPGETCVNGGCVSYVKLEGDSNVSCCKEAWVKLAIRFLDAADNPKPISYVIDTLGLPGSIPFNDYKQWICDNDAYHPGFSGTEHSASKVLVGCNSVLHEGALEFDTVFANKIDLQCIGSVNGADGWTVIVADCVDMYQLPPTSYARPASHWLGLRGDGRGSLSCSHGLFGGGAPGSHALRDPAVSCDPENGASVSEVRQVQQASQGFAGEVEQHGKHPLRGLPAGSHRRKGGGQL